MGATKRNHRATARNHGATEAQPSTEDKSATAQPAAYRQPVRLRVPWAEGAVVDNCLAATSVPLPSKTAAVGARIGANVALGSDLY